MCGTGSAVQGRLRRRGRQACFAALSAGIGIVALHATNGAPP